MNITVNFGEKTGKIKAMHGIGQPPFTSGNSSMMNYLKEAGIPYSRLHDVGGAYGGYVYVDIPNIFRNFDAPEDEPSSYDFAFTDWLIKSLLENGSEPIFRFGITIENCVNIKAYRTGPPKDYGKWARICGKIISHYNQGWAEGFYFNIKYWEIWNEPDLDAEDAEFKHNWNSTAKEFYRLYAVAAVYLKKIFPKLKIGGPSLSMATERSFEWFENFLKYITTYDEYVPLDFLSWHSYWNMFGAAKMSGILKSRLLEYGYTETELMLNEWNNSWRPETRGTLKAAAKAAGMMLVMQKTETNILAYYDARLGISNYAGMFNPLSREPFPLYYSFKAFNELYKLENEVRCSTDEITYTDEEDGLKKRNVLCAAAEKNGACAIMIANIGDETVKVNILADDMDIIEILVIDETHLLNKAAFIGKEILLAGNSVVLIKGTKA